MSKYLQIIGPLKGEDGKSAYQYAQDGGYTGTEAEFAEKLAAEGDAYTLPIASSTQLGGVKPVAKTDAMTQSVGVDAGGGLWTEPGSGGGSGDGASNAFSFYTNLTEDVQRVDYTLPANLDKIYIMNINVKIPTLDADMSLNAHIGGNTTNGYVGASLTSGNAWGFNVYLLRTVKWGFTINLATAKTYPENARPGNPSMTKGVDMDTNVLSVYSNTSGVSLPTGSEIYIWGVYSE